MLTWRSSKYATIFLFPDPLCLFFISPTIANTVHSCNTRIEMAPQCNVWFQKSAAHPVWKLQTVQKSESVPYTRHQMEGKWNVRVVKIPTESPSISTTFCDAKPSLYSVHFCESFPIPRLSVPLVVGPGAAAVVPWVPQPPQQPEHRRGDSLPRSQLCQGQNW